jgi:exodeoxyribonuclease V alpha subunit
MTRRHRAPPSEAQGQLFDDLSRPVLSTAAGEVASRADRPPPIAPGVEDPWADPLPRVLADRLATWAAAAGDAPDAVQAVHAAALALVQAVADGHVCIPAPLPADRLRASRLVGPAEAPGACPLVLDADGRLYLHRDFDHERALARRLRAAARPADDATPGPAARARLRSLAPGQAVAVALALRQRLAVLSGGPGTGKTTTVVHLLACLLEDHPTLRIALAAPTGKAAARMTEALRQRADDLPPQLRARLPASSSTVHRLLGLQADTGRFRHGAEHRLPIDLLVVDEASMLDLALARRLLDAVPDAARIVLLGDKDQLAAVESGAVFADVSAAPVLGAAARADLRDWLGFDPASAPGVVVRLPAPGRAATAPGAPYPACSTRTASAAAAPAPRPTDASDVGGGLRDAVVWLTRAYRFDHDSVIGSAAAAIRDGDALAAASTLDRADAWVDDAQAIQRALDGYQPLVAALRRDPTDAAAALAALGRFRVLCAVHEGPWGVRRFNERLAHHLRAAVPQPHDSGLLGTAARWFTGQALIVRRNDPTLRLWNGDVALVLPDASGALAAVFAQPDGSVRRVPPARLPPHDEAFAMTVHKSQGSEFDAVLVCLPDAGSRPPTRELLYTALTRARLQVAVRAPRAVFAAAVASPTLRSSGLRARLAAPEPGPDPSADARAVGLVDDR